ncbi:DNA-directed RNA polymerase sigma-70 factor [Deinococcus cellulosilyticus NBRC 106333 = KACC 11606]|uniref:DNA-directed RNA polymerase sigma-70 factor n=2 Tax=Deinococcus cellulosilyticus TaxID=401558 RepID=A0A511N7Y9_DEIC1|nr:DNA-directed RNA polymerase sigma-70 factor [Deinococcus cellulosilyticus NBRC 106333 = KACC 11606]
MLTFPARTLMKMPTPISDAELIVRFEKRDESALSELYDRYVNAAYGLALRTLEDQDAAQEVVQDAFLKIWNQPRSFDPSRASFAAFFMTMVRNLAIDTLRKRKYEGDIYNEEGELLPFEDQNLSLQERAELGALGDRVRHALSQLSAAHRETVERAYFKGESREEIALAMGVPVGTVKSRLKYALDRLKDHLKGIADEV